MGKRAVVLGVFLAQFMISSSSSAQQVRRYQDWTVSFSTVAHEASTSSTSGGGLGVFCILDAETCVAYVTTGTPCSQGGIVPVLINSDGGSNSLETECRRIELPTGSLWVNVFTDFEAIAGVMLRDSRVGIAVPYVDGGFKAFRFSLMGSNQAISAAKTLPEGRGISPAADESF